MSRVNKFISLAASALVLASCGPKEVADKANISGVVAPSSQVVIGMLDMNQLQILDTLQTAEDGSFKYEVDVKKGNPEFVYVYSDGNKVTSLLLEAGDAVSFTVNADGNVSIEGSDESVKLMQVEKEHAEMTARFEGMYAELESASKAKFNEITREMAQEYRQYNRSSVKYIMENTKSLTVIPVIYRKFDENLPLFNNVTDAVLFRTVADSLLTVYPESRYVKSLSAEADLRFQQLELQRRMNEADVVGYFDIELPGLDGQMKKLSDLDSKVVMLYFWTASSASQNMSPESR